MAKTTKSLMEQLSDAQAKVAEIQREITKTNIRKLALVVSNDLDFELGKVVVITRVDAADFENKPFKVEDLAETNYDWATTDDVEILTYERARELLIAEVDRKLSESYPDETKGAAK